MAKDGELKVFITNREASCQECGEDLGRGAWITLVDEGRTLCLVCADLDHLVFLPSGDAAVTRRARKHSTLAAVVLKWSRARKRYERQGLLVEEAALTQAETECAGDAAARAAARARARERRERLDEQYVGLFAQRVRELFSACPPGLEVAIAEHACEKYSGRVGRSAAARDLDKKAVELAVVAHIRHAETEYDELLMQGCSRQEARVEVAEKVASVVRQWEGGH